MTVSEQQEPELFWALRGGGGNFGVVTMMEFAATTRPSGFGGIIAFRHRSLPDTITAFRDLCLSAPDELGLELRLISASGETISLVSAFWSGHPESGAAALRALGSLGAPDAGEFTAMRYAELALLDDEPAPRLANHQRSAGFLTLDDDVIQSIAHTHDATAPDGMMTLIHWRHGAATHPALDACAYPHRSPAFEIAFAACWRPGRDAALARASVDGLWRAARGEGRPAYVGMVDDEASYRTCEIYGPNLPRLLKAKRAYDPHNVFGQGLRL